MVRGGYLLVYDEWGDGDAGDVERVGAEEEAHLLQVKGVQVVVILPVDLGYWHLGI